MIDTASALARMNDTYDHQSEEVKTYGIRFVSKNGFREIYNARKGVKHPKQESKPNPNNRGKSQKKLNGLVQVFDDDIQEFRDIKFAQIIAFRNHKESVWIPVKLI